MPVLDFINGHLGALSDDLAGVSGESLQILLVARLTGHGSEGFMPYNIFLFVVLDALSQ